MLYSAAMLEYIVQGRRLEITASEPQRPGAAASVFEKIRADPKVPDGFALLLDTREFGESLTSIDIGQRIKRMIDELRPKMLPVCAVVIASDTLQAVGASFARDFARQYGVTLRVCYDLPEARRWLDARIAAAQAPEA